MFHQRCGTALAPTLTPWSHEACHTDPVQLTAADYPVVGADAFSDLPAAATGTAIDATGGYHDAGDYDRRIEHLAVLDALVDLFEIDPQRFSSDALSIPESGNGIPDLLDEALWAIDLYIQLQDADGGVRAGIETTGYPEWGVMPEDDSGWRRLPATAIATATPAAQARCRLGSSLWDCCSGCERDADSHCGADRVNCRCARSPVDSARNMAIRLGQHLASILLSLWTS